MCDPLAKVQSLAPFGVHVVWVKIARLARVQDDIGLRDRTARQHPRRTDRVVLELKRVHRCHFSSLHVLQSHPPPRKGTAMHAW